MSTACLDLDRDLLQMATADLLSIPAGPRRAAALADFVESDPDLGRRLSFELAFALS